MRHLAGLVMVVLLVGCGSAGPAQPASRATPTPSPTPTPVESGSIVGSWHLVVTTTQAYGDLTNKAGEQYTRDWTLTKDCPAAGCVAQLQTVTGTGPTTLNWTFESGIYKSHLTASLTCPQPNSQGGAVAVDGLYTVVVTAAATDAGVFRATTFGGTFVEDFNPNPAAAAQHCVHSHIEQRLDGTRTG